MFTTGALSSLEIMTKDGWDLLLPSLPGSNLYGCMVLLNSTTAFLIGGVDGSESGIIYSPNTLFLNTESSSQEWVQGPTLNIGRDYHSCGRIRKDSSSHQFSVIVVGGGNKQPLKSVEILDEGASEWRNGPDLPFGIRFGSLVEDPTGGVILVGGFSSFDNQYLQTLLRLSDAGDDAKWIEMPQKLKFGRNEHTSFLVPNNIVSCSLEQEDASRSFLN